MLISIQRSGKVQAVKMIPNSHKCAAMRTRVYRYHCTIEANDTNLSPEGYVLNNEKVQEFFERKFGKLAKPWDAMSCELMALTSAKEICAMLLLSNIDVVKVKVTFTGSNGATITAEYDCKRDALAEPPVMQQVPAM